MLRILLVASLLLAFTGCASGLTIRNDPGGRVVEYAINAQKATSVRFDGKCMSACTLYLSSRYTCITPRASFWFHQATHPSATEYMLEQYPAWVRDWLEAKGGLTRQWLVIDYGFASQHMRKC